MRRRRPGCWGRPPGSRPRQWPLPPRRETGTAPPYIAPRTKCQVVWTMVLKIDATYRYVSRDMDNMERKVIPSLPACQIGGGGRGEDFCFVFIFLLFLASLGACWVYEWVLCWWPLGVGSVAKYPAEGSPWEEQYKKRALCGHWTLDKTSLVVFSKFSLHFIQFNNQGSAAFANVALRPWATALCKECATSLCPTSFRFFPPDKMNKEIISSAQSEGIDSTFIPPTFFLLAQWIETSTQNFATLFSNNFEEKTFSFDLGQLNMPRVISSDVRMCAAKRGVDKIIREIRMERQRAIEPVKKLGTLRLHSARSGAPLWKWKISSTVSILGRCERFPGSWTSPSQLSGGLSSRICTGKVRSKRKTHHLSDKMVAQRLEKGPACSSTSSTTDGEISWMLMKFGVICLTWMNGRRFFMSFTE